MSEYYIVKNKKYKLVPVLEGYEKDPGEELVIEVEIRHVSLKVLQDIFQDSLIGSSLLITKEYEDILYRTTGIKIDTDKLDFFIEACSEGEEEIL